MAICQSSLVHTEETTQPSTSPMTYASFSRRFCYADYLAADRVYSCLDKDEDTSRAERLNSCRTKAWFVRHSDTGVVRVAANSCHLRWCPVCARARRNYISREVSEWLNTVTHPKFLTLTIRHTNAPLAHQVYWLYRHFSVLRRRKDFRKAITGGVWFFQIKKSTTDNLWHPHLHCLVAGEYLPRRRLSYMWTQVTFGSVVADIRSIRDPLRAAQDAARYSACPGSLVGLSLADACELVGAMHRRRICGTWGSGRAVSLRPPRLTDQSKWEDIGGFSIVYGLRNHDDSAKAIWEAWNRGTYLKAGVRCTAFERWLSDNGLYDFTDFDLDSVYNFERGPP